MLRATSTANGVAFSVEDHGAGVLEELRHRLFEPIFSARDDCTGGPGLAITRKPVVAAGGMIRIEDARGGGAHFCLELQAVARAE
ncbi:MAG: sensor histidine kinase [bacterium]|nr:sensor histidine kinase [bacterium]